MLIKNVLKKAAAMLGLNIDLDAANAETDKDIKSLIQCADIVNNEIFTDYFPLLREEEVYFNSAGYAETAALGKKLLRVLSLKYAGVNIKYTIFPGRIYVNGARNAFLTMRYAHAPETVTGLNYDTESDVGITERIFALGVAGEYCLINGMIDESRIFDKRYKDSLLGMTGKRSAINVRQRKWPQ
ncbi:MAG: hypothetical protein LBQ27_02745 [Clostridiales bacterium]|nr:hypothetical protein [Clostridiales bacterium]